MTIKDLKTSLRYLGKNKIFTFINILGLFLGMFCVIVISLWINYEKEFDRFHENYDQLYRVVNNWGDEKDVSCPGSLAGYLRNNYPEVVNATTYSVASNIKLSYTDESNWVRGGFADSTFFRMFSFPILYGDHNNIYPTPNSAVITQDMAEVFFGDENPMGKMMIIEYEDMEIEMEISGIIENVPENSSLQFDFLMSSAIAPEGYYIWTNNWPEVFVQLKENTPVSNFDGKITDLAKRHDPEAINTFELKQFRHEHLYSLGGGGLIRYVRIFGVIAFMVLLIACFNYINLSTARQSERQKDIGVKKVLGITKALIYKQSLFEVAVITLSALILAFLGVKLFLPFLNNLLNKNLVLELTPFISILSLSIIIFTVIVSGVYPAFYLGSLNPVCTLTGNSETGSDRKITLRKILVVCQFTFTIILIISLTGMYKQIQYIQNKDLGFRKEGIVIIPLQGNAQNQLPVIKDKLMENPNILNVTGSSFHPVLQEGETSFVNWKELPEKTKVSTKFNYVDYNYVNTFDIDIIEGRFFSDEYADHSSRVFVINEELKNSLGLTEPVGSRIALYGDQYGTVIGVMKNFHNETLYDRIREYTLMLGQSFNYLSINMRSQNVTKTLEYAEKELKNIEPSLLFSYQFLDEEIKNKYSRDMVAGKITSLFTILSLIISSLGLSGLVLFIVNRYLKEIGIRKVFGARVSDILINLNSEFIKWAILSLVIAVPVSIVILNEWLTDFTYKTDMSWWIFILTGIGTLFFIVSIVSVQCWKSASKNPVDILKYE